MDLFVYGTLRCQALMDAVSGRVSAAVPATIQGYAVHPVRDHIVPMIVGRPESYAEGVLYLDVDATQSARLDFYEGAFDYTLIDVRVDVAGDMKPAKMYLPPRAQPMSDGPWSLADWQSGHLAPTLLTVAEIFSLSPSPSPQVLKDMWPVIEKRAWAKHRAATTLAGGADLRHKPSAVDVDLDLSAPPSGDFFRLQSMRVDHLRFDGTRSGTLTREVFDGVDAALILPYDPLRDRVLLVEQLRMGPLLRRDSNPWMLEPIAGMIDARETPRQTAIREGMEEAGLTFHKIMTMPDHYPSPGGSTDFFYCFLGLCDLPNTAAYSGGLAHEAEDLRLHSVAFDDALKLIDTGEIRIGVLIMMLYWLGQHRDSLRSNA